MTVRPGDSWGRIVSRPDALRTVNDDAELAAALTDGSGLPTAVLHGDLARTLGTTMPNTNGEIGEFTVDLVQVVLDDGIERVACAHVVARPEIVTSWAMAKSLFSGVSQSISQTVWF